ncbi:MULTISPECIES: sodium/sugar symporter [unclassified Novosphingobium]|uniref:sodium/sugar symporter n=1 Tax=unclassified Novosphingobium TaxID=2644732 RepID=UPI00086E2D0A|nr:MULTISPECIES: sodium/sugar symporter [unclassified Novosphingobium]MDR6707188.1 SSS family solute:Na+ symporter [Novosphingobium sp. 1748]ODU82852.1 MAG: sodium transporter [Novosphingobium sp. SCN 63-17]OJX96556.1 MAG: sodium transporter [Novosphingobium sp. 63-713]
MTLSTIDTAMVVAYAIFIFGLAQWVSRRKGDAQEDSAGYFLASRALPWWAIGASLIAANISAEQIVGMAGSGYAIGLAISSYEWMAALTLLIVGKFFLPVFLKNNITTMPEFLEARFGPTIRTVMAVFWLVLYVFVNLTSILWLGSIAVRQVAGVDQDVALAVLGVFALAYQIRGGLKAVALTDIVQVALLVMGGLIVSGIALGQLGEGAGALHGFERLVRAVPDHFHMILSPDSPHYKDLPGLGVLIGGLWIANLSYWGFNQYIIQRTLAAKSLGEAQRGIVFAAFLKLLMPVIIVLPGIAAVLLAPDLTKPDQAYPAMMHLLPNGLLGLVFAALTAAIIASTASKINSIATIFTLDLYARKIAPGASEVQLVRVGRITACVATVIGIVAARPLLGGMDQAFQYIQEFSGFVTPGITVIFLTGLFWPRATEAGALAGALASVMLSALFRFGGVTALTEIPFMHRMAMVFFASLALTVVVSLLGKAPVREGKGIMEGVSFATSRGFVIASALVSAILVALYTVWW